MQVYQQAIALFPALLGVASAVACTNVTIASSDDADAVRRDCKVISGDLVLDRNLAESISLDGIESINGGIYHKGCLDDQLDCPSVSPFSISSSTLTSVNGSIDFWYFNGLRDLSFPSLALVQDNLFLKRMHFLEVLDITKLTQLGFMVIEAPDLTTVRHEKLERFTPENGVGSVEFWAASVDSVDSFFSSPMQPVGNATQFKVSLSSYELPNIRSINIGWSRIASLTITGDDLSVTLGGTNTTSMEINILELRGNITNFERSTALKNLTIGEFSFKGSEYTTEINLDFDQVSLVEISLNTDLKTITLPPAAVNWTNLALKISGCPNLTLDSQFRNTSDNSSQEQIWYWPQSDMQSISIRYAAVSNKFLYVHCS